MNCASASQPRGKPSTTLKRACSACLHANLATDDAGEVSVLFESRLALVSDDVNGSHMDTYRWHDGELSLISPGDTTDDAWYSGNDADGKNVFFFTTHRIDPREIEDADFDLYDARVGGGFSQPPAPQSPCQEQQCFGPPAPQPGALAGGSDTAAPDCSSLSAIA